MFKSATKIGMALLAVAALMTFGLVAGCGGSGDGPEGTVETFFKAVGEADEATMRSLVTGNAKKTMPKPGAKQFKQMAPMGQAFEGVVESKVDGDTALVTVKINGEKFLSGIMEAMLASIKDPEMKKKMEAQMKASMAKEAKKLERSQIKLVKEGGKWLISDFVKK